MTWKTFRPLGSRILVRMHDQRAMYGRFFMPDDHRKQPESGEVIAVGPDAPKELQPGQIVIAGKYNGVVVPSPDHDARAEYRVMQADHSRPVPHCPDVYLIVEFEPGEDKAAALLRIGTDVPKVLCA